MPWLKLVVYIDHDQYRTQPSVINFAETRHYVWVIFPNFSSIHLHHLENDDTDDPNFCGTLRMTLTLSYNQPN